jgi:hypothetical protein
MTVYSSPDEADFFADYKRAKREMDNRPTTAEHLDHTTRDIFRIVDDLQWIVTSDTNLGPTDVGTLTGKLTILRILLNAKHRVRTPHIDRNWPGS